MKYGPGKALYNAFAGKELSRRESLIAAGEGLAGLAGVVASLAATLKPSNAFAQNALPTSNVPCIVNGQRVDNCVDLIYQRSQSADDIYPGAKATPRNTLFATRYKFLNSDGEEWTKYFFEGEEISKKTQEIFRKDPLVNFEALYGLHIRYRGRIEKVGLFREGFMVIGVRDPKIGGFIIPISPRTIEELAAL